MSESVIAVKPPEPKQPIMVECDICKKQVTKKHIKSHQKSMKCQQQLPSSSVTFLVAEPRIASIASQNNPEKVSLQPLSIDERIDNIDNKINYLIEMVFDIYHDVFEEDQ